jgi:pimeloyl-ACP methyl ester carboxylesterase
MLVAGGLFPLAGCGSADEPATPTLRERLDALGAAACPGARAFSCFHLPVPLDPARPRGAELDLAVAVRPASGDADDALGPLFVVDGGPGVSGIDDIDDWSSVDPRLRARFDLVYFDLRGLAGSGGVTCPKATATYYAGGVRAASKAEGEALADRAARYSADCADEVGWAREELAELTTAHAAEDIEAVRVALGAPAISLYGLSYGTQLSQAFARSHPDRTRAVVIDGVVDLTWRDIDYASDLSRTVNGVLDKTFARCAAMAACAADLPDAPAAYDAVGAALEAEPAVVQAPSPGGAILPRRFTRADLDTLTVLALGDQNGRATLLRAVAAAALRADHVPLRRLLDYWGGIDPETDLYVSGTYSDAIYYTVTCNDYGSTRGGAAAWIARGEEDRARYDLRSTAAYYGDLPCASWVTAGPERTRPAPFAPAGVPVLLVNAEGDVATPGEQGEAVFAALRASGGDAWAIHVAGGHHVMWGYDPCVDPIVVDFLFDPDDPSAPRERTCDAGLVDPYLRLGPLAGAELTTALEVGDALANEILALPGFPWSGRQGCDRGGSVAISYDLEVSLEGCVFFDGLTIDGHGGYDWETGELRFTVELSGVHTGSITYENEKNRAKVSGMFDGQEVGDDG